MAKLMLTDVLPLVKQASKVAARSGRVAYLRNVWLRMTGQDIFIQASDGSMDYEARMPMPEPVAEEMLFGVDGNMFAGLLGRMGRGEVDLSVAEGKAVLTQGRRKFELAVADNYWAAEFDPFPEQGGFFMSGKELADIVSSVEFCAMSDETMGALACVLLDRDGPASDDPDQTDRAAAVALNGHQLAVRRFNVQGVCSALPEMGLKLRRAYWPEVRAWLGGREIEAAVADKRLHLRDSSRTERWSLSMTLAEYPQWRELLNKYDSDCLVTVQRQALMDTLERLRFFVTDNVIAARWTLDEHTATLRVESDGRGRAEDYVAITRDGHLEKIMLPVTDMIDILKHFQGDEVELAFAGNEGPCVIRDRDAGDEYLVLVMPMKVQEEAVAVEET